MEPNLHDIDDYNNNESPHKRKVVRLTILLLVLGALIYGGIRFFVHSQGYGSSPHVVPAEKLEKSRAD